MTSLSKYQPKFGELKIEYDTDMTKRQVDVKLTDKYESFVDLEERPFDDSAGTAEILKLREAHKADKSLETVVEDRGQEVIEASIATVDKRDHLHKLLEKAGMKSISGETQFMVEFSKIMLDSASSKKNLSEEDIKESFYHGKDDVQLETYETYLLCLDMLMKGVFTHWQIRLQEQNHPLLKEQQNLLS